MRSVHTASKAPGEPVPGRTKIVNPAHVLSSLERQRIQDSESSTQGSSTPAGLQELNQAPLRYSMGKGPLDSHSPLVALPTASLPISEKCLLQLDLSHPFDSFSLHEGTLA